MNVSSVSHKLGPSSKLGIMWDDMNQEKKYDSDRAYSQSKLANILHAMELAKRLKDTGIVAYSLHPGNNDIKKDISLRTNAPSPLSSILGFVDTDIFDKSKSGRRFKENWMGKLMFKLAATPLQGAQTTLVRK